jgi:hypothetical protein
MNISINIPTLTQDDKVFVVLHEAAHRLSYMERAASMGEEIQLLPLDHTMDLPNTTEVAMLKVLLQAYLLGHYKNSMNLIILMLNMNMEIEAVSDTIARYEFLSRELAKR